MLEQGILDKNKSRTQKGQIVAEIVRKNEMFDDGYTYDKEAADKFEAQWKSN